MVAHRPADSSQARHAVLSVPWPAARDDVPRAEGIDSQTVALFEPGARPRLRRYLLLCHREGGLPGQIEIAGGAQPTAGRHFSDVRIAVTAERLEKGPDVYNYSECEARIRLAGREIGLRLSLRPRAARAGGPLNELSHWQWCAAEQLWAGPLAEVWRIGGYIPAYSVAAQGRWQVDGFVDLGNQLADASGDILHADVFLICWKTGLIQATCHFKSVYLHALPKPIAAFAAIVLRGLRDPAAGPIAEDRLLLGERDVLDFRRWGLHFHGDAHGHAYNVDDAAVIEPWNDLRVLAFKSKDNELTYLPPGETDCMPAGVSRSIGFDLFLGGGRDGVGRYVLPAWAYVEAGELRTAQIGPAARAAWRSLELIGRYTQRGGFDTGRLWRNLRRDLESGKPYPDAADWDGDLAAGEFTLAYQCAKEQNTAEGGCATPPTADWLLYLQHAYHAADVAIEGGTHFARLEGSAQFSAPLPKFRFSGLLLAYLETADPYLLERCQGLASAYMTMERVNQPRRPMGRDAWPLRSILHLWDYDPQPLYLDFARQTAIRLLRTQEEGGGFSRQAGCGRLTRRSAVPNPTDITFGSGLLAPVALMEWARRDWRHPPDFFPRLRRWVDLMLRRQLPDGLWPERDGAPGYPLISAAALMSLTAAGEFLGDPRCAAAVGRTLRALNEKQRYVSGTHAFLLPLYAHWSDGVWEQINESALA